MEWTALVRRIPHVAKSEPTPDHPLAMMGDRLAGVSSSFDYVPRRSLPGFILDPDGCSAARLGLMRRGSSRLLIALVRGQFLLCTTQTRDFADSEVRFIVHTCGQLYLDVSGKTQIDDFEQDVQQLTIADPCRTCRNLATCSATYSAAPGDFFGEDERWLRSRFSRLSGSVLDIGAGSLPYLDALASPIQRRTLRLHAIDPVVPSTPPPPHVAFVKSTVEAASFPEEGFDACIAIRSLNHFYDVERALTNTVRWLRAGGVMLLVESLPLPLLRSPQASARAHRHAPGGFQHHQNLSSHDLLRMIEGRLPLTTTFHRPVARDTTDQWILEFVRS